MCQILQGSVATHSMCGWSIINDFAGKQIIAESKQKKNFENWPQRAKL